ncbi:MAG: hypothetical protein ACI959_000922 [Limisphaerales bacterium]
MYNLSELIPPTVDGFSATLLDIDDQGRSKIEKINGEQYYTMLLYKAQLYPLHSGEYYVDPYQATVTAKVPTGKRVRDFWGSRAEVKLQSIPLKSQKLKIGVKELPTAGKPKDFHGAVGEFDLSTSLDLTETKTGEPLTLRVVVSGKGNLKLLAEPDLKLPPGFESYDPQIKKRGNSKTYEYLLIPNKPGNFELQPYAFSYFDTKKGKYINLESPVYNVTVNQGEVFTSASGGAGVSKEDVARLADDIRYLAPEVPQFGAIRKPFFGSGMFYFGLAAPFLFAIPLFLVARRQKALAGDVALTRNKKARKLAEKRFKNALAFVNQNDKKAFYDELVRAIWGYLTDKFSIDPGNLSRVHIQEVMAEKGVSLDKVEGLVSLLDRGEMALYAPLSEGALESDYDSAVSLLEAIDTELSK